MAEYPPGLGLLHSVGVAGAPEEGLTHRLHVGFELIPRVEIVFEGNTTPWFWNIYSARSIKPRGPFNTPCRTWPPRQAARKDATRLRVSQHCFSPQGSYVAGTVLATYMIRKIIEWWANATKGGKSQRHQVEVIQYIARVFRRERERCAGAQLWLRWPGTQATMWSVRQCGQSNSGWGPQLDAPNQKRG